jgi:putative membrane protein
MNIEISKNDSKYMRIIAVLSVAIPLVVALLLMIPQTGKLGDLNVSFLPHLHAILNSATAVSLLIGFFAIKTQKPDLHKTMMMFAVLLSSLFLISYVTYHFQGTPTYFGDANFDKVVSPEEKEAVGGLRTTYLLLLVSHIILATIVVPLVLLAIYFAFSKQFDRHKKIVKWTFPVWLYVAISGVMVYWMISPYYQ